MKMFVFPHSGGFGYQYNFFKKFNFEKIDEVYTYDYPRKYQTKNTVIAERNFEERVEVALQWILSHDVSSNNVVLFGHSLGAFVAYEVGLALKNRYAIEPSCVIMSSQNPPVAYPKIRDEFREMHGDLDEFLGKLGGMTTDISNNKDSMEFYKAILNTDLNLLDNYEPSIPDANTRLKRLFAFYADKDPILDFSQWNLWDSCASECRLFPYVGNHFYIYDEMESVMSTIDGCI